MFPETFAAKHLAASKFDGVLFDPFCGRGTAVFEALLSKRSSAGCDVNPVAVCISGAKCNPPTLQQVLHRLSELEQDCEEPDDGYWHGGLTEFFELCFKPETLCQLRFLRSALRWKQRKDDRFIAAIVLGALHGESHRSPSYLSNRMPRTISTKPRYSVNWWNQRKLLPPYRNVFKVVRDRIYYRFASSPPTMTGKILMSDARNAGARFPTLQGKVTDIITSPPYLDTTNYKEDQWLRMWFLGHEAQSTYRREDGRHTDSDRYWKFLSATWAGVAPLLADRARVVVRIGGRRVPMEEARERLRESLKVGLARRVRLIDQGFSSEIRSSQANTFRGNKVKRAVEHDFCFDIL